MSKSGKHILKPKKCIFVVPSIEYILYTMFNVDEIRALLVDLENDRVERTISTTNTDKFGQAICAFANDLPNHAMSGYLFLGVKDNGELSGIKVTDDLLKNVAAIRTDGNIQPQPSMTVEKVSLDGIDMVMVKVEPSAFPPVRYKGRIWVRIGPRKGVANEEDERILMEKRRANVTSFDASPCLNATLEDLDLNLFKHYFLPKAMSDEAMDDDRRDVEYKLASFGFYDTRYNCPTNAGLLFFAKHLRRFIPGAYIQNMCVMQIKTAQAIYSPNMSSRKTFARYCPNWTPSSKPLLQTADRFLLQLCVRRWWPTILIGLPENSS